MAGTGQGLYVDRFRSSPITQRRGKILEEKEILALLQQPWCRSDAEESERLSLHRISSLRFKNFRNIPLVTLIYQYSSTQRLIQQRAARFRIRIRTRS